SRKSSATAAHQDRQVNRPYLQVYDTQCLCQYMMSRTHSSYSESVPKLWSDTIETHRREVRDAILETTVALVTKQGLRAVTMSQIADEAGIGRATLYKYFPDV